MTIPIIPPVNLIFPNANIEFARLSVSSYQLLNLVENPVTMIEVASNQIIIPIMAFVSNVFVSVPYTINGNTPDLCYGDPANHTSLSISGSWANSDSRIGSTFPSLGQTTDTYIGLPMIFGLAGGGPDMTDGDGSASIGFYYTVIDL